MKPIRHCAQTHARRVGRPPALATHAVALLGAAVGVMTPAVVFGQSTTVSVEESGPLPTIYTKRFNWRILSGYRHTTMVASSTDPLACEESPCLDDGEPGDQGPDGTRGGTASAAVGGMDPGAYQLELRFNQTENRATSVPWSVVTDAAANNARSGTLDQRNTTPGAGNWLVLGNSTADPIQVASTLTFVLGSDAATFNGSLSYGGIRLLKVAEGTGGSGGGVVDGGVPVDPACDPLLSREYADAPAILDEPSGSAVRLAFHIDGVPPPMGLTSAQLTMTLYDADHPGEEGTVYVNGQGPLQLPANVAWGDTSSHAVLAAPLSYLLQGTNLVEFGVGSRPTSYYRVSQVALELSGPPCGESPDGGTGGGSVGGAGAGAAGAGGPGAGANAGSGGTSPSAPESSASESSGGCACVSHARSAATPLVSWAALGLAIVARSRGGRSRSHGPVRPGKQRASG
jgi:hypothetical protein